MPASGKCCKTDLEIKDHPDRFYSEGRCRICDAKYIIMYAKDRIVEIKNSQKQLEIDQTPPVSETYYAQHI